MVFYEKPFLKFERLLETYVGFAPRGYQSFAMAIPLWLREKLFQKDIIRRELRMARAWLRREISGEGDVAEMMSESCAVAAQAAN